MKPAPAGDGARPSAWNRFLGAGILPRAAVVLIGAPALGLIAWFGGWWFRGLIALVVLLGALEFQRMMAAKGFEPSCVLAPLSALALAVAVVLQSVSSHAILTVVVLMILGVEPLRRAQHRPLTRVATTLFGALYVGWLAAHLVLLREFGGAADVGLRALGLVAAATWACDILAFLVGVSVGRHLLAPHLSPKKTVEGAAGGVIGAVLAGTASALFFADFLSPWQGAALGLVCGVVGQVGDLFESLVKRDAGIKDTADLLPGHGGVLDRFDSLLFNAPLVYWLLRSWGV